MIIGKTLFRSILAIVAVLGPVGPAGCGRSSAAHARVTGEGRRSWPAASEQALKNDCGIPNPTAPQIESAAELLKQFGIQEVENAGCWGTLSSDPSTPQGVDTENCGVGAYWKDYTSVALPPGFCGAVGAETVMPQPDAGIPETETSLPPLPPTPKPDAGAADAGAPEAVTPPAQPDAGTPEAHPVQDIGPEEATVPEAVTPPVLPDAGVPEAETAEAGTPDAGAPEVTAPEAEVRRPEAAGPSPLQTAREGLQRAINQATSMVDFLNSNGAVNFANGLAAKIATAQGTLNNSRSSQSIESAAALLNAARRNACQRANTALIEGGGTGIQCP